MVTKRAEQRDLGRKANAGKGQSKAANRNGVRTRGIMLTGPSPRNKVLIVRMQITGKDVSAL